MTTMGLSRQPTQLDYASPTQFKWSMIKLPKVEYFCADVNIPGVSIGSLAQATRFKDAPLPGNTLSYEDCSMTFIVDENLENYREIHGWLVGLGTPSSHEQFRELQNVGNDRFPTQPLPGTRDGGIISNNQQPTSQGPVVSDATLSILTSKNNPAIEVRFQDMFPTRLSGLSYSQQETDITYLTATVTLSYLMYEFATPGASRTTTTLS